jgi:hypothetical protein
MGTNTFIGTPKIGQKPIWTLIYGQCGRQTFPIGELRKLTAATHVCEGTENNHVCLLGIKGEAYVASKPSHFFFIKLPKMSGQSQDLANFNSLGLSMRLSVEVSKWVAPGLKCSSARCGLWWQRDTCSLDPPSPRIDSLSVTEMRSWNEPHLAWNVPTPGASRGGEETHVSLGRGFCVPASSAL